MVSARTHFSDFINRNHIETPTNALAFCDEQHKMETKNYFNEKEKKKNLCSHLPTSDEIEKLPDMEGTRTRKHAAEIVSSSRGSNKHTYLCICFAFTICIEIHCFHRSKRNKVASANYCACVCVRNMHMLRNEPLWVTCSVLSNGWIMCAHREGIASQQKPKIKNFSLKHKHKTPHIHLRWCRDTANNQHKAKKNSDLNVYARFTSFSFILNTNRKIIRENCFVLLHSGMIVPCMQWYLCVHFEKYLVGAHCGGYVLPFVSRSFAFSSPFARYGIICFIESD